MDYQADMNDQPIIDPDFEPQARPRSCTWPTNRPNALGQQSMSQDNDMSIKMEATIAECSSQEQLVPEEYSTSNICTMIKEEINTEPFVSMSPSSFPQGDYPPGVMGSPTNLVSDLSSILQTPSVPKSCQEGTSNPAKFVCSNIMPSLGFSSQAQKVTPNERVPSDSKATDIAVSSSASAVSSDPVSVATSSTVQSKPKTSSRKNAWGNMSYADLITQGIESSPEKRLTLAQIYDWMVKNVPYFKDKGDSNSSAGWKNSIRHNLSLHSKFKRIQNEGTGKSSWWVINYEAKPGKSPRRRTTSMDNSAKFSRARSKANAANKKELKKEKASMKAKTTTGGDSPAEFEHLNKSLESFRQRTSSNASSISGRVSPKQSFLTPDLEDDGPPPLSPLSSYNPSSTFSELFGGASDNFGLPDCLDPNSPGDAMHAELLDSIRTGMNLLNPSSPMTPVPSNSVICTSASDRTNIYLNNIAGTPSQSQQVDPASASNASRTVLSSPNLASLLQGSGPSNSKPMMMDHPSVKSPPRVDLSSAQPRVRANTMPGQLHPHHKLNLSGKLQRQITGSESLSQECLYSPFKEGENALSSSPQTVYRNKYQYNPPKTSQPEPSLRMNAQTPVGMSSYANSNQTLCQLLVSEQNPTNKAQVPPGLKPPGGVNPSLSNQVQAIPLQAQQGLSQVPDMQMQNFQTSFKDNLSTQAQQPSNKNGFVPMNQDFPAGINLEQDFFNPGPFDFDQVLQNMDVPEMDDFDWLSRQDQGLSGPMDVEPNMETNTLCDTYGDEMLYQQQQQQQQQYNQNMMNINSMNVPQQQPQQRQQPPPPQYTAQPQDLYQDTFRDATRGVMQDMRVPMNGGVVTGSGVPVMAPVGYTPQYMQSRHTLQPQPPVSSIGQYRM